MTEYSRHEPTTFEVYRPVIIQHRPSVIQEVPRDPHLLPVGSRIDTKKRGACSGFEERSSHAEVKGEKQEINKRYCNRKSRSGTDVIRDEDWSPTGSKHHCCMQCSMRFKKPSALVIHMRTHSGERPYTCHLCSKSFSISGNLRRHVFTHTGEKPFKCDACGRRFNNPSHLTRHAKKIHI